MGIAKYIREIGRGKDGARPLKREQAADLMGQELVLSVGAVSLLNWLIRHSEAVNVASLFYLVPPCTALLAWLLFGDSFSAIALLGMALAVGGVYLARK